MKNPFDELNSVINSTSTVHDIQTFFSNTLISNITLKLGKN